ncbi:MAG: DUF58 domain-containing protein [Bryobacteraceae bacterium]|jgi:uncharacterized protein (DUF58 family)
MAAEPILNREFLEKLERLTILWQRSFAGLVGGHNLSRLAGPGQEFLDHRNFHNGDDLRAVNWRAYLRLEKLFLKMFQTEPRVPLRMLVDTSDSMLAHGGVKFEYARRLAAALCYVGLVRLDSIEVHGFTRRISRRVISSGGRHRFPGVMDSIAAIAAGGATDYQAMVREFIESYPQRGLAIIISDFLDDHGCERALEYLSDFGHELMLLQLWAPQDRTPPWLGELELRDAESGEHLKLDFDEGARARYTRAFDEFSAGIETVALRSGGRYAGISTDLPLEEAVFGELIRARGIA